jgi:hypothetical protein
VLGVSSNSIGGAPVTVSVDLTGIAAGTPLRLYFDLIGSGPATSEVDISNVQLSASNVAPTASDERVIHRP